MDQKVEKTSRPQFAGEVALVRERLLGQAEGRAHDTFNYGDQIEPENLGESCGQ